MPTTPPKTDPALERLARLVARKYPYLTVSNECRRSVWVHMPKDLEDRVSAIILQTLAPLAEVVEAAKKLGSEVGGLIGCNEIALREIAGHTNVNILDLRHRDLFQSLAKLDAGREE